MARGSKSKTLGGDRRSCVLPCGKIVQGNKERLKPIVRLHQRTCEECRGEDCSWVWKAPTTVKNPSDIHGSNSGSSNREHPDIVYNSVSDDGDINTLTGTRSSGLTEDLLSIATQSPTPSHRFPYRPCGCAHSVPGPSDEFCNDCEVILSEDKPTERSKVIFKLNLTKLAEIAREKGFVDNTPEYELHIPEELFEETMETLTEEYLGGDPDGIIMLELMVDTFSRFS